MEFDIDKVKSEVNTLIDELIEITKKMENDEDYMTGVFYNLVKKAESGDVDSALKISILAKIMTNTKGDN